MLTVSCILLIYFRNGLFYQYELAFFGIIILGYYSYPMQFLFWCYYGFAGYYYNYKVYYNSYVKSVQSKGINNTQQWHTRIISSLSNIMSPKTKQVLKQDYKSLKSTKSGKKLRKKLTFNHIKPTSGLKSKTSSSSSVSSKSSQSSKSNKSPNNNDINPNIIPLTEDNIYTGMGRTVKRKHDVAQILRQRSYTKSKKRSNGQTRINEDSTSNDFTFTDDYEYNTNDNNDATNDSDIENKIKPGMLLKQKSFKMADNAVNHVLNRISSINK